MEITVHYFDGCPKRRAATGLACRRYLSPNGYAGSPSILVNGADVFPDPAAAVGLACRRYVTPNGFAGSPTLEQLRAAIFIA